MRRPLHLRAADGGHVSTRKRRWLAYVFAVILGGGAATGPSAARPVPFTEPLAISMSADGASSVSAADVDGDGDLDALSASLNDDRIAWHENDGTGTGWALHTISASAGAPRSILAADVDGDGDLDVLSACFFYAAIVWYENDGSGGGWTLHTISDTAYGARSVSSGDVDGDGDLDALSASNDDDKIAWYENDGAGAGWTLHTISTTADGARSVFAADIDGDGDLDALSASFIDDKVAWYENDGAGGGWPLHTIADAAHGAVSVFAADADGDGDLDTLSASFIDDTIAWYENDGSGAGWTPHAISTSADFAYSVVAADLDGDGDVDTLAASVEDDTVAWYENDGAGGGWTLHTVSTTADGARSVFAVDLDGDGDLDTLSASNYDDTIAWYRNDTIHRSAAFPERSIISAFADGARAVSAADVDGDGDLDALSASDFDANLAWHENDGAGAGWTLHTISTATDSPTSMLAADVDGDGDLDALSASLVGAKVAWHESDGTGEGWTLHTISTAGGGTRSVFAADVDGDGDLDALSASSGFELDAKIAWHENDGSGGGWTLHTISIASHGGASVVAADLDGDGDPDALAASGSGFDETIAWYENDGSGGGWNVHTISTAADGARSVVAADVDGDGDLDTLSASYVDDTIAWHENDGSGGGWTLHTISTLAEGANSVFATDLDGDGDPDALSLSFSGLGSAIAWYENDGAGAGWTPHVISSTAGGSVALFAADLDSDGDLDALSAAYYLSASSHGDAIAWYENRGGQFSLPTTDVAQKVVGNSEVHDLLAIQVVHRGRAGDNDVELASLELLLGDASGTPLTTAEANGLIQELRVYRDDGSGVFEEIPDTLVATVADLSLTAGVLTIPFADGAALVRVVHGIPETLFVVAEMSADAQSQVPAAFALAHLTEATSSGEDADHHIPLTLENVPNVGTGRIDTALTSDSCQGPFDLELSNRTVEAALSCQAGTVLRAGNAFVVVSPAVVSFRARDGIELSSGFEVRGGSFRAEIGPPIVVVGLARGEDLEVTSRGDGEGGDGAQSGALPAGVDRAPEP